MFQLATRIRFLSIPALLWMSLGSLQREARAGVLLNGSLEDPALTSVTAADFSAGQTIGAGGWIVQSGTVAIITSAYVAGVSPNEFWPGPSSGNQWLYDGEDAQAATVYQDVGLEASTTYNLTFDLADLTGSGSRVDELHNRSGWRLSNLV